MKNPIFRKLRCMFLIKQWVPLILVAAIFVFGFDSVFASSGSHEPKGWVSTDSYRVFNFIVLAVGIFFVVKKPVITSLEGRVEAIKSNLEDLESQKKSVQANIIEYDNKLAKLDDEVKLVLGQYVEQGKKVKENILAKAESTSEKIKQQAKDNIDYEFEQARYKLKYEVVELALIKAESIIRDEISGDDQEKLIDEYLDKVVA